MPPGIHRASKNSNNNSMQNQVQRVSKRKGHLLRDPLTKLSLDNNRKLYVPTWKKVFRNTRRKLSLNNTKKWDSKEETRTTSVKREPGNNIVTEKRSSDILEQEFIKTSERKTNLPHNTNDCIQSSQKRDKVLVAKAKPCPEGVSLEATAAVDNYKSNRTTKIELSAQAVNSSCQKYSDFSISFLLNQNSPSVKRQLFCGLQGNSPNSSNSKRQGGPKVTTDKPEGHSSHILSTTSSGDYSNNKQTTPHCADHCHNKQTTPNCADHCHNEHTTPNCADRLNKQTTPHCADHCDNNLLTGSIEDHSEVLMVPEEAAKDLSQYSVTRCLDPTAREINRKRLSLDEDNMLPEHTDRSEALALSSTFKMTRFKYKQEQIIFLQAEFTKDRYPSHDDLVKMSLRIDVPVKQLQIWFQNKRASITGTRKPKAKRTYDSQDYHGLSKRSMRLSDIQSPSDQMCLAVPASNTENSKPHSACNILMPDFRGLYISPSCSQLCCNGSSGSLLDHRMNVSAYSRGLEFVHSERRNIPPIQYLPYSYNGLAQDAGHFNNYLASAYSYGLVHRQTHQDVHYAPMMVYQSHLGVQNMANRVAAHNDQLISVKNPALNPRCSTSQDVSKSQFSQVLANNIPAVNTEKKSHRHS